MSTPTTAALTDPKTVGKWGKLFEVARVAVHATLLPNGRILCWGRRSNPKDDTLTLDEHQTKPFFIDLPISKTSPFTASSETAKSTDPKEQPKVLETINLFCSGHCLQPNGTLLIAGGHQTDGVGINQACVYDFRDDSWTPKPTMNDGRWYPSCLTLPDGSVLVMSGSHAGGISNIPQIWRNGTWVTVPSPPQISLLYTKLHLDPKGRVFVAGPQAQSQLLDGASSVNSVLSWEGTGPERSAGAREYGSSVMYDSGKILYTGGGNSLELNAQGQQVDGMPTRKTEIIDLNKNPLQWIRSADMQNPRRHHNATVLPDGTVLVNGGTQGTGFDNLQAGMPVHQAELWSPSTQQWTPMAAETANRCYHSIALLLPDGQVLSAGGGEYGGGLGANSLTNAQLFSPPYLFKGDRPTVQTAPPSVIDYGQEFAITVRASDSIAKVSWVRIGSVTHTNNMNQSLVFLKFEQSGSKITVHAPANPNLAPPGHYMLFLINQQGVPCVAPILKIRPAPPKPAALVTQSAVMARQVSISLPELNEKLIAEQEKQAVVVGLTPVCPYGLGPCWGGAFEALQRISDVDIVRPVPDQADSVAFVYLKKNIIPDIDVWRKEFATTAHGSYEMRGIEMTLRGIVTKTRLGNDDQLTLAGTSTPPQVVLAPFQESSNIQYDIKKRATKPITAEEAAAYTQLSTALADHAAGITVQITGRLHKHIDNNFSLDVRKFEVVKNAAL